ncbi:MAG: WD40 repeat domain-containing protein, partial [Dolichospermum sp.]
AKAKITPPALITCFGSLQPPGTALIRTLVGHLSPISSLAITPDSTKIISVGGDTIKVWDLATGKELYTLTDHVNKVVDVAITPDGTKIISGSWDKTIKVWDLATGKELYTLADHVDRVVAVAITPDGTKIISVDAETIKVWNSATMKQL